MNDSVRQLLEQATRELRRLRAENERLAAQNLGPIAVIGLAGRFPGGANDPAAYFRLLATGGDAVQEIPAARIEKNALPDELPGARFAGLLDAPIHDFDAAFFGISPREAMSLDPQQRLLLEVAWEALEDAGLALDRSPRSVGVFVGLSNLDYQERVDAAGEPDAYSAIGNLHSTAAGRISYALDLHGPCMAVDTACSSSLVALHLAMRSLAQGECELALAGGVQLLLSPLQLRKVALTQALSPDGRCRAFDARANGFVRAEGCGLVLLKPLARALRDGDPIRAVLRGSAVNHDGKTLGLTAPSARAQERLLRAALSHAGLSPQEVSFIEAHGTGTELGDPIEMEALRAVYGAPGPKPCFVGSCKTNVGHMEAAAGIGGLTKLILSLEHETIPAHLHFSSLNPRIELEDSRLQVAATAQPWPRSQVPRRGAVSSFGISGTNAHVLVEEAPVRAPAAPRAEVSVPLLPISARSQASLAALLGRYRELLAAREPGAAVADLAYSIAVGRSHEPYRRALVGRTAGELLAALEAASSAQAVVPSRVRPRVVFVFSGQGGQWPGMGLRLLAEEPVFAQAFAACEAAVRGLIDLPLREVLRAPPPASRLQEVDVVQPCLWAFQVALAALLRSWGVEPDFVIGHSMGEVAAAHVSGALSLADAARIICTRSKLLATLRGQGGMALIDLPLAEVEARLRRHGELSIAAQNGPRTTVVSGSEAQLGALLGELEAQSVFVQRIKVEVASHCALVDPILPILQQSLATVAPSATNVAMLSTVTGARVRGPELDGTYFVQNLRQPVRFAQVVTELAAADTCFVELSPHPVLLASMTACCEAAGRGARAMATLVRDSDEPLVVRQALGQLYEQGHPVSWVTPDPSRPRVPLPTYPWQRQTFCVPSGAAAGAPRERGLRGLLHRQGAAEPTLERFEATFAADDRHFSDHRVAGKVVMPAAGYLQMALHAARVLGLHAELREVRFEKLLELPESPPCAVELSVRRDGVGTLCRFEVASRREGDDAWVRNARGFIARGGPQDAAPSPREPLSAVEKRCPRAIPVAVHEAQFAALGFAFGPRFRCLVEILAGEREAVVRARLPVGAVRGGDAHPSLVDACLQALFVAAQSPAQAMLPVEIERLRLLLPLGDEVTCHAVVRAEEGRQICGDLYLWNRQGLCGVLEGVKLRRQDADDRALQSLYYRVAWPLVPRPAAETALPAVWIWARSGDGAALAEAVRESGSTALLRPATAPLSELSRQPAPAALVAMLGGPQSADPARLCGELIQALRTLVQALLQRGDRDPPRLFLVTRGAQALTAGEDCRVEQAAIWGFGRSLMHEHPELKTTLIDLDVSELDSPGQSRAEAAALLQEMAASQGTEQLLLRRAGEGLRRHSARLVPDDAPAVSTPARGRPFAARQDRPGLIDSLVLGAVPRRAPAPGWVEIEVRAAGLNFLDVLFALDALPGVAASSAPLGGECVGRIAAVGAGVVNFTVGQQVIALASSGFATHAHADQRFVVPLPELLNAEAAATLPIATLTAYYALHHVARLRRGERLLIHAAAGGVGLAALRIAQQVGAEVHCTAGSEAKRDYLRALGVASVASSRDASFVAAIRRATFGEGVDVVLNSLALPLLAESADLLREGGRFIELGKRDYLEDQRLGLGRFLRRLTWSLVDLRSMMSDAPEVLAAVLREVAAGWADGTIAPLPHRVVPIAALAAAYSEMARGAHVGKIVIGLDAAARTPILPPRDCPLLDPQGLVLITGGLGGIGLRLARALVGRGVKRLVLLGRSAPSAAALAEISELRQQAAVQLVRADVGSREQLAAALATLAGPVRGVLHCAGVLDDGALLNLTAERVERVLRPKVHGAVFLHELLREQPLDFFVLCGSASAILGSPGQSVHAAANAALAALAHHRRSQGLPALCIDWGAWDEVGLAAARPERGERLAHRGVAGLSPEIGAAVFLDLLERGVVQSAAMRFSARQFKESHLPIANAPLLSELAQAAAPESGTLRSQLGALPEKERPAALCAHVAEQVQKVLRRSGLGLDEPLAQAGLDSLMAMELRNRLEASLGLSIPVTLIWRYPSIRAMAEHLARKLGEALPAQPGERTEARPDEARDPGPVSVSAPAPAAAESVETRDIARFLLQLRALSSAAESSEKDEK